MGRKTRKNSRNKLTILGLVVCVAFTGAFAERPNYHSGSAKVSGGTYHYRGGYGGWGGRYNRSHWWGYHNRYSGLGAFYWGLPFGCTSVVIGGVPYYYYDGTYLEPYGAGYLVVADPTPPVAAVAAAPVAAPTGVVSGVAPKDSAASAGNEVTVNIPDLKGAFTAVKLTRHGKGYLGPQGEFYTGHPTVAQLKALYGD
jgi:hypothetical protein